MTLGNQEERESKLVTDKKNILYILDRYLQNEKLYLKNYSKTVPAKVEILKENQLKIFLPFDYQIEGSVVLYSVVKKYIEFEFNYISTLKIGSHLFEPSKAVIATSSRRDTRYDVLDESVKVTKVQILPNADDIMYASSSGVSLDVIFNEYERRLLEFYPKVEIAAFHENDELVQIVNQTQKMLALKDCREKLGFYPDSEELVHLGIALNDRIDGMMESFEKHHIRSLYIYPVIFHRFEKRDVSFAYIKIWSEEGLIDDDSILAHLNHTAYELRNKIRHALVKVYKVEQGVINISKGGIKLLVDSEELKDSLFINDDLILDLSFDSPDNLKPITFKARLISRSKGKDGNIGMGIAFLGSEEKGYEKLEEYLKLWLERNDNKQDVIE